jgi:hypothetical protein
MTQSSSVESVSPELDALEAFLGSTPEELVAFTETPFGGLLAKVNELGFDGDMIQAELASTGILDAEAWTSSVGVDLSDFLELTPLEYANRYPEQGLPLVAAILNSIHLSEEQASLHSVAGGTNLSKGEKIGIAVGSTITGMYVIPKICNHLKMRSYLIKEQAAGRGADLIEGRDLGDGVVRLRTDIFGIKHFDYEAKCISTRLQTELNHTLFPTAYREIGTAYRNIRTAINPDWNKPKPDNNLSTELSEIESTANSDGSQDIRYSIRSSAMNNELLDSNAERASIAPGRELRDLSRDWSEAAQFDVRPKSLKHVANSELDSMVDEDLGRAARSEMASLDFDRLYQSIESAESNLLGTEKATMSQALDGFESSVQSDLGHDIGLAEGEITDEIDKEVAKDEIFVEDAVQTEELKLETAISVDTEAAEEKAENAIGSAE